MESYRLKNELGRTSLEELAELVKLTWPQFLQQSFVNEALKGLETLELKARVLHIAQALKRHLPEQFEETARILLKAPDFWQQKSARNWSHYAVWPLIDYVGLYGLEHPEIALSVLERLTPLFTAEFAIRPFLEQDFELTHQQLMRWTQHKDEHVRRLASECIRPRLPWASQLPALRADPSPLWPILERLKTDPSLYVRRSVANNLNDISKDHPEQVMTVCRDWLKAADAHTRWVVRHGLRTLVKEGRDDVYPLLGFSPELKLKEALLVLSAAEIRVGDTLSFSLTVTTTEAQKLVLDYRVGYAGKEGRCRWKVFKWKTIETQKNTAQTLHKSQLFQPLSTRQLYPGKHLIECLLNGQVVARAAFELSL